MDTLTKEYANNIQKTNLSERQSRVLLASLDLFSELGFENTKASDIARKAKVSEGTVFSHFKTKEGILEAIISPFLDDIIPEMIRNFSDQKFTFESQEFPFFLHSIIEDRLYFIQENIREIKIIFYRALVDKSLSMKVENIILQSIVKPLSPILDTYKEKKMIVDWPNERIVRYMISLTLSYILPSMIDDTIKIDIKQATNEIVEFLTKGLLT